MIHLDEKILLRLMYELVEIGHCNRCGVCPKIARSLIHDLLGEEEESKHADP